MVNFGAHEHHGNQYLKSGTAQPTMIIWFCDDIIMSAPQK